MQHLLTGLQPAPGWLHPKGMASAMFCTVVLVFAAMPAVQATGQNMTPGQSTTRYSSAPASLTTPAGATLPSQKTGAPAAPLAAGGQSAGRGRSRNVPPAPLANGKVEVIGLEGGSKRATIDQPLLPGASFGNNLGIRSGTSIEVRFTREVDSGHAHNGDTIAASLAQSVANLPAGTPVKLTVVQASPAGALLSFGELSLQVIRIGDHPVLSDTVSAQGKEGKRDMPDSAPSRGTEAVFTAGQVFAFPAA